MVNVIKEVSGELGAEEKLIALNILLVIYLHDKRYADALEDITELLVDPEMQSHREFLLFRQLEIKSALVKAIKKRAPIQTIFFASFS